MAGFGDFVDAFAAGVPAEDHQDRGDGRDEHGQRGIDEHHYQHTCQEEQRKVAGVRGAEHPERGALEPALVRPALELDLAQHDGCPGHDDAYGGHVEDDFEGVGGHEVVQRDTQQGHACGDGNAAVRYACLVHAGGELGGGAVDGHRAQDAAGGVQAGVEGRQGGGKDHEVHDDVNALDADGAEERHERADALFVGGVGQEQGQQDDGADVEHGDPEDHGVDGLGHDLFRVFGFSGCGAHELNGGVSEQHALHEDNHGQQAVGEDTAVVRDEAEAHLLAVHGSAEDDEVGADDEEDHQGGDLDQGEPEFHLAEDLHRDQVQCQDHHEGDQRPGPLRDCCHPGDVVAKEVHVQRGGGDVHDGGGGPVDPVEPAGNKRGLFAEEFTGVGDEGARGRAVQHQFAQGPKDQEREEAAYGVGNDEGGARGVEAAAGAEEQAGADRAADGDHLDLPRLEVFVVALVLGVQGSLGGMRLGRDRVVRDGGVCHGKSFGGPGGGDYLLRLARRSGLRSSWSWVLVRSPCSRTSSATPLPVASASCAMAVAVA